MKTKSSSTIKLVLIALTVSAFAIMTPDASAGDKVAIANLPPPVTLSILDRYPQARFIEAEAETKNGVVTYEVEIKVGDKELNIDILGDGRILKVDD